VSKELKKDAITATISIVVLTVLFGLVYPLVTTGVSQLLFPNKSDGSKVEVDGQVVGSSLIAQPFKRDAAKGPGLERDPAYFQPRPSATGYSANVTFFNNLGPNSRTLSHYFANKADAYIGREGRYTPGLTRANVPVDAVTTSASGVDPQISQANARIQANRVAAVRNMPIDQVLQLIDDNTQGRALGVLGEPGVNVLELNIALDEAQGRTSS
jgi:K+-transporting ATPase ATPase C chain